MKVVDGVIDALKDGSNSLVGLGLSPEGIEQNDVIYELMTEFNWRREKVDLDKWIQGERLRERQIERQRDRKIDR